MLIIPPLQNYSTSGTLREGWVFLSPQEVHPVHQLASELIHFIVFYMHPTDTKRGFITSGALTKLLKQKNGTRPMIELEALGF